MPECSVYLADLEAKKVDLCLGRVVVSLGAHDVLTIGRITAKYAWIFIRKFLEFENMKIFAII